ncbi:hypothetical protein RND81_07G046700 [Saponaria officinalis]|uniref:Reverse transcriptase zinc-binding domain-containing protein n=1 Tax=Saponaria officinalis TaxID=3572 RepID=A0AAW1JMG1_SAPOF
MEVLSRMLRAVPTTPGFSFHPKCCRVGLTHLIFADDLLVFTRGDYPSIKAIDRCLGLFASYSGLCPNPAKTNIYFAGVRPDVRKLILLGTNYVEGTFPFKYLGVPLYSSRLTRSMFYALIEKIKSKIRHWSNNFLSYAGRIQLLNSVVFGMESFWCACFLLPQWIISDIDKLCRQFLWGQAEGQRRLIYFSWEEVCRPGVKGGFGIREVLSWNKALLVRILWRLHTDHASLWCEWARKYVLCRDSCWSFSAGGRTGLWRVLHQLRDELIGKLGSSDAVIHFLEGCCSSNKLRLGLVYSMFRGEHPNLYWAKTLLDPIIVPRHAVVVKLAVQNGLPTVDNLNKHGLFLVNRCILCKAALESCLHVFYDCCFSAAVIRQLFCWLGIARRPRGLKYELRRMAKARRNGWRDKWARCTLAAGVYFIWQERNFRIFHGTERTVDRLVFLVKYNVAIRLYANVSENVLQDVVDSMLS